MVGRKKKRNLIASSLLRFGAALLAAAFAFTELPAEQLPGPRIHYRHSRTVAAWLPYWTDKNGDGKGWEDVQLHASQLDQVSFFAFNADPETGDLANEGELHGMKSDTLVKQVAWLHARDIAALFTVTQFNHVGQMLSQPDRLEHLIEQISDTCSRYNFDGVDIDFEDFKKGDPGDSARYTAFIEQLSAAMHAKKDSSGFPRMVVATVLPHTDRGSFQFIDYNALGKTDVDRIQVMAYDEYYPGSKLAGANAPAPWVASIGTYLSTIDAPAWKFVLGVPGYGYRWPVVSTTDWSTTGKGLSVTFPAAQTLMTDHNSTREWSDDQRAPYFSYTDSGQTWIAFYEDAESWQTKLQTVILPSRLNGISAWAAGFEDPDCWPIIDANLATPQPIFGVIGTCYWRYGGGARLGSPLEKEGDAGAPEDGTFNGYRGRRQNFEKGSIYYRWGAERAYIVDGNILTAYIAAGGPQGNYGFPTGDPINMANGLASQQFEHGVIVK